MRHGKSLELDNARAQKGFYNQRYVSGYREIIVLGNQVTYEISANQLRKKLRSGNLVLDLGCGRGIYVPLVISKGASYIGVDISSVAIAFAKEKYIGQKIDFIVSSVENLPFRNDVFDIVFHSQVLEHVQNPKEAIKESARVLNWEGFIIASIPCGNKGNYEYLETIFLLKPHRRLSKDGFPIFYIDTLSFGHVQRFTSQQISELHAKNQVYTLEMVYFVHWFFPIVDRLARIFWICMNKASFLRRFLHSIEPSYVHIMQEIQKLDFLLLRNLLTSSGVIFIGFKERLSRNLFSNYIDNHLHCYL